VGRRTSIGEILRNPVVIRRFIYLLVLMTLFNFMSHGTQDQYPTFLKEQHRTSADLAVLVAVIYNLGALCGGMTIGALSQSIGRRKAVVWTTLLALPVVPLFAFSPTIGLLAAINLPLQTRLAGHFDENFGMGMAVVIVPVLILTALVTWVVPENRKAELGHVEVPPPERTEAYAGARGSPGEP
jgi:MFS family permease